jgi:hypothetical protein
MPHLAISADGTDEADGAPPDPSDHDTRGIPIAFAPRDARHLAAGGMA